MIESVADISVGFVYLSVSFDPYFMPAIPTVNNSRLLYLSSFLCLTVAHWKNLKSVGKASFVIHNSFAIAVLGLINRRGEEERKGIEGEKGG